MNRPDTNRIKEGKPVYGAEKACGQRDGVDLRGEGPDGRIPDVRRARTDELSLSGRLRHDTDTRGLHIGMFCIRGQRLFRSADTQERGRAGRVFRCLLFQHLHRLRAVPRAARRHTLSGKLLQRSHNADARPGTVSARSRKLVLQHTEHHPYPPFRLQDHLQIYSVGHAGRKLRGRRHGRPQDAASGRCSDNDCSHPQSNPCSCGYAANGAPRAASRLRPCGRCSDTVRAYC